ncbi:MAG: pentapeptide repeat-containing protein, partial [Synechococcales bacterium]|nr:pentapeptide repeat-containing protein [Synechococcales bacterium]
MTTTKPSTMAATVKASAAGLDRIDKARRKKGWTKTEKAWAGLACTSEATLKRFWAGVAIRSETFRDICGAVGIDDWESIVDFEDDDKPQSEISSRRLSVQLDINLEDIDGQLLKDLLAILNKIGSDGSIKFLDVDEGSIKLILGGSEEALERIEALFKAGELAQIEGIEVQDVHFLERDELVALIRKNGGVDLDLSKADLGGANLSGAALFRANLFRANLSRASLYGANLINANLSGADLFGAVLSTANLFGAVLGGANLSGAALFRANLFRANLSRASLSGANLS